MKEIRFHGRGGQGAVTSAELIAISAINGGHFAQAFPSFGPERRGAPVVAYCRVDSRKINIRAKVYTPDIVVVLDYGLMEIMNVVEGAQKGGVLVVNTKAGPEALADVHNSSLRIATVDANTIAAEELGRVIVNTTMIGAFIRVTGIISIEDIRGPVMERFGDKLGAKNMKALERAYNEVVMRG